MTTVDRSRLTAAAFGALLLTGLAVPAVAQAKGKRRARKEKSNPDIERQKLEDARLTRECRGRPNAGACLGYAR
ncbi:hypothetical protein [Ottowia sp.]|mgnify:FL=1|uniref:hypothetical protein n=1 Tax=Ottowia sp. TaxID=1898956 RepID=UPI002BB17AE7|nr:hypothetical protein [Ottowia sp.]MCP5257585.1 hypothetical protein [Burkholderiaceae bacterium]HPK31605.1 hypothetical protein [Ottowia sp.]HPR45096.1 hypothetical protein [Ottowia sp.]HRW72760.1 hypothetical protein [Ottowia sp.]